jgi:chromosome segregation ATPase
LLKFAFNSNLYRYAKSRAAEAEEDAEALAARADEADASLAAGMAEKEALRDQLVTERAALASLEAIGGAEAAAEVLSEATAARESLVQMEEELKDSRAEAATLASALAAGLYKLHAVDP